MPNEWTEMDDEGNTVYCKRVYKRGRIFEFHKRYGTKSLAEVLLDMTCHQFFQPHYPISRRSNTRRIQVPMHVVLKVAYADAARRTFINHLEGSTNA